MALNTQDPEDLRHDTALVCRESLSSAQFESDCFLLLLVRFYKHVFSTIGGRCQMCKKKVGEGS